MEKKSLAKMQKCDIFSNGEAFVALFDGDGMTEIIPTKIIRSAPGKFRVLIGKKNIKKIREYVFADFSEYFVASEEFNSENQAIRAYYDISYAYARAFMPWLKKKNFARTEFIRQKKFLPQTGG